MVALGRLAPMVADRDAMVDPRAHEGRPAASGLGRWSPELMAGWGGHWLQGLMPRLPTRRRNPRGRCGRGQTARTRIRRTRPTCEKKRKEAWRSFRVKSAPVRGFRLGRVESPARATDWFRAPPRPEFVLKVRCGGAETPLVKPETPVKSMVLEEARPSSAVEIDRGVARTRRGARRSCARRWLTPCRATPRDAPAQVCIRGHRR
jgi:hypothetical protein